MATEKEQAEIIMFWEGFDEAIALVRNLLRTSEEIASHGTQTDIIIDEIDDEVERYKLDE